VSITEQQQQQTSDHLESGTWQADPVHSSLGFEVRYMGIAKFSAPVPDFRATLADGRLTGAARIESVDVKDESLHAHLLSPEFFDAERHPEVILSTGELVRRGDEVELDGEVTIKGVTRPVTLRGTVTGPVADPYGNPRYGLRLETTIDRTEFGIDWNADMPAGGKALANDVTLRAELSLVQAA
jgi:polyisoprenoid-binding protein YceI